MIETHIHIIPGVDDGAGNIDESKKMLEILKSQGITAIITSSHYREGIGLNEHIEERFNEFKNISANAQIEAYLGNELFLDELGYEALKAGKVYSLAASQYVLVELPFYHFYPFHKELLYRIQMLGYKIILAHVERYRIFHQHPELLAEFIEKGMYGQLTTGIFDDRKARKTALKWIKKGYIHVIGSDGHNTSNRPPKLKDAYDIVSKKVSVETADLLFNHNPRRIIENQALNSI